LDWISDRWEESKGADGRRPPVRSAYMSCSSARPHVCNNRSSAVVGVRDEHATKRGTKMQHSPCVPFSPTYLGHLSLLYTRGQVS